MTIALSYYAEEQRSEILRNIAINLSFDDALRWNEKIHNLLMLLAEQPELGHPVRPEIFLTRPLLTERLREIFGCSTKSGTDMTDLRVGLPLDVA